jgi:AAA lid domain
LTACVVLQRAFELAYAKRDKNFGNGRFVRTIFKRSIEQQANRVVNLLEKLDNSEMSLITGDDLFFVNSDSY